MYTVQWSEVEQSRACWVGDKAPLITPWPRRLASTREYSRWGPLLSSQPALQSPPVLKKKKDYLWRKYPLMLFMFHDSRAEIPTEILHQLNRPQLANIYFPYVPSALLLQEGVVDPPGQRWRQDCGRHWCLPWRVPPPGPCSLAIA